MAIHNKVSSTSYFGLVIFFTEVSHENRAAADISCRLTAVERLPVLHHSADCISFPLRSLGPLWYLKMEFCSYIR